MKQIILRFILILAAALLLSIDDWVEPLQPTISVEVQDDSSRD